MARLTIERAIQNLFFKDDFQGLLLREPNLDSGCPLHALKQKNIVNLILDAKELTHFLIKIYINVLDIFFLALKELDIIYYIDRC